MRDYITPRKLVPLDGWNRAIIYKINIIKVTIGSYGRDNMPGGKGAEFATEAKAKRFSVKTRRVAGAKK